MDVAATPPGAEIWTTTALILIAIGIACAIGVIRWGTAMRRRRKKAIDESALHAGPADQADQAATDAPEAPSPAPVPAPAPAPQPLAAPAAQPIGDAPALTQIKGLGPKAATQLTALGITGIDQLAALGPAEAAAIDRQMGALAGRLERDRWIEQARLLAAGDRAGFEAAFGKLG